jgi:Ribosomal protein L11 methylase
MILVCANILSNILIDISSDLKHLTNKRLILSGILNDQIDKVISTYSDWIDLRLHAEEEDWVLLEGKLKS